jgi:hypothetical protein
MNMRAVMRVTSGLFWFAIFLRNSVTLRRHAVNAWGNYERYCSRKDKRALYRRLPSR